MNYLNCAHCIVCTVQTIIYELLKLYCMNCHYCLVKSYYMNCSSCTLWTVQTVVMIDTSNCLHFHLIWYDSCNKMHQFSYFSIRKCQLYEITQKLKINGFNFYSVTLNKSNCKLNICPVNKIFFKLKFL